MKLVELAALIVFVFIYIALVLYFVFNSELKSQISIRKI